MGGHFIDREQQWKWCNGNSAPFTHRSDMVESLQSLSHCPARHYGRMWSSKYGVPRTYLNTYPLSPSTLKGHIMLCHSVNIRMCFSLSLKPPQPPLGTEWHQERVPLVRTSLILLNSFRYVSGPISNLLEGVERGLINKEVQQPTSCSFGSPALSAVFAGFNLLNTLPAIVRINCFSFESSGFNTYTVFN